MSGMRLATPSAPGAPGRGCDGGGTSTKLSLAPTVLSEPCDSTPARALPWRARLSDASVGSATVTVDGRACGPSGAAADDRAMSTSCTGTGTGGATGAVSDASTLGCDGASGPSAAAGDGGNEASGVGVAMVVPLEGSEAPLALSSTDPVGGLIVDASGVVAAPSLTVTRPSEPADSDGEGPLPPPMPLPPPPPPTPSDPDAVEGFLRCPDVPRSVVDRCAAAARLAAADAAVVTAKLAPFWKDW